MTAKTAVTTLPKSTAPVIFEKSGPSANAKLENKNAENSKKYFFKFLLLNGRTSTVQEWHRRISQRCTKSPSMKTTVKKIAQQPCNRTAEIPLPSEIELLETKQG